MPLLAALFLYNPSPMLILIAILAYPQIKSAFFRKDGASPTPPEYDETPLNARINYGVYYLGLVAFLSVMTYELHRTLGNS